MDRRAVLAGLAATAAAPAWAQTDDIPRWSSPVFDTHFHMRANPADNIAHQLGAGITSANLIHDRPEIVAATQSPQSATTTQAKQLQALRPDLFKGFFAYAFIGKPDGAEALTEVVKAGAKGLGEFGSGLPDVRRAYALAADLDVPVLVHILAQSGQAPGLKEFIPTLKEFPRTRFIAHAHGFWNNVSADYHDESMYLTRPVVPGGISDKLLSDYPNLYADLSDPSAYTALSFDHGFTADFLKRHQDKLHFGSDCACLDGRGKGQTDATIMPPAMLGKCNARLTLQLLTDTTTPEFFRKLVWTNGHRLLRMPD